MNSWLQSLLILYLSVFQELMELIAKSNSMSTAELSQMKAELKLKQKVTKILVLLLLLLLLLQLCHIFFSS